MNWPLCYLVSSISRLRVLKKFICLLFFLSSLNFHLLCVSLVFSYWRWTFASWWATWPPAASNWHYSNIVTQERRCYSKKNPREDSDWPILDHVPHLNQSGWTKGAGSLNTRPVGSPTSSTQLKELFPRRKEIADRIEEKRPPHCDDQIWT